MNVYILNIAETLLRNASEMYACIYVVVNFFSQVIFIFLLSLGMLMYANDV